MERTENSHSGVSIAIVSRDEEFVRRLRLLDRQPADGAATLVFFDEWLPALVWLLKNPARVVIYDLDFETMPRNLEMLKAIRLICRHGAIILSASEHSRAPFENENDVGIYYRILKSAPDSEFQTAIRSAERAVGKKT